MKKNIAILIVSSLAGILWAVYLLYNERGGNLVTNDWMALCITCFFVVCLGYYFVNKWKKNG